MKSIVQLILSSLLFPIVLVGQSFYFGADLSYVNEMEDCGITYYENEEAKDPYAIFADHNCNLVRLRLWHTPDWYDELNSGKRYSNLADVKKSIRRGKEQGMRVLLDFHLSDDWADPGKQVAPKAWQPVVNNLPVLSDSLYNYVYGTLNELRMEDLLPEMIQIGNETNKGILLSQEQNDAGWVLDWERNAVLFNRAIKAVRDLEEEHELSVDVMLHIAGPADTPWFIEQFIDHGVTDFDLIGMSYYWNWHSEASLQRIGEIIRDFRSTYPQYQVMIVETGYPWTIAYNDEAGNILSGTHPDFSPVSPENQAGWMIALTEEVINNDGLGVIYWEPAWVSSDCATQWGKGSHYEHATFFDFQNNLLTNGGIRWMTHEYGSLTNTNDLFINYGLKAYWDENGQRVIVESDRVLDKASVRLYAPEGRLMFQRQMSSARQEFILSEAPTGIYFLSIEIGKKRWSEKVFIP